MLFKSNNYIFEYEIIGDSEVQIFLFPGYGDILNKWSKKFIDNLSRHFQVILFNYPKVGNSESNLPINSFDDYSEFFYEFFLNVNFGKKFVLFGFSMGAYVLRNLIIYNKKISPEKLVFSSGSFGGQYRVPPKENVLESLKKEGADKLHLLFSPQNKIEYNDYIRMMIYPTEEHAGQSVLDFQAGLIYKFFQEHCADIPENKISFDALILHGLQDVLFPKENAEILMKFCSKQKSLFLTEGGHGQLFEFPDKISEEIVKFCL